MTERSGYRIDDPEFWSPQALEGELRRVFQICNGCRLCHNLCPSFPALFSRTDALDPTREDAEGKLLAEGAPMEESEAVSRLASVRVSTENPVDRLGAADIRQVVDLCYNCKLCFPICPYVPPHEFEVDFPRLMLRAKAMRAREEGVTLQDRFLGATEFVGAVMTAASPLANWANHNPASRFLMEKTVGVHRERELPGWAPETFERFWEKRRDARGEGSEHPVAAGETPRALLFYTCHGNYNDPEVPQAAVEVLERAGVAVAAPPMRCCGMPALDGGDVEGCLAQAKENVARLLPWVDAGYAVVSPGPTCTFMLRHEYPELLRSGEARAVGAAVRDLGEYLVDLRRAGRLSLDLAREKPLRVAYHFPCHLKVQKIGMRSKQLLEKIPGVEVEAVDRCCGMDGTWGMKKEFYELSLGVAAKAKRGVEDVAEEASAAGCELAVASDCPLAALQLRQATGRKVVHPILLLRDACREADAKKKEG